MRTLLDVTFICTWPLMFSVPCFPVDIIPPMLHTHLHLHVSHHNDERAKPENLLKKECPFANRELLDEKVFSGFLPETLTVEASVT